MHRRLQRQIKRFLSGKVQDNDLKDFIDAVDQSYQLFDEERELIERSLDLTSQELSERNRALRNEVEKQQLVQEQLGSSLAALNATFDATGEAIIAFNKTGEVIKYNQLIACYLGLPSEFDGELSINSFKPLFRQLAKPGKFLKVLRRVSQNPAIDLFGSVRMTNGHIFEYHSSPQLKSEEVMGRVWCFRDITELKKSEATIQFQAYHDSLTKLPNRSLLDDRLEHAIRHSERYKTQLAVLFIDLDDFKKINDNAGHQAGDQVLQMVAERIKTCTREVDTLARLGGDEFVIVLENLSDHKVVTSTSERILEQLSKPYKIGESEYFISSSIGISVYPKDGDEPDELMRKADMAMYHAKSLGKSNHQYFDEELERSSMHQLQIENLLRDAITRENLHIYYQPKVDLKTNEIASLEALLRWQPHGTDFVSPDVFIPIAEQTGLINQIGEWVLNRVCEDIANWQAEGLEILPVSVNISPIEFRNSGLIQQFKRVLKHHNTPPDYIEIEITESLFFDDMEHAKSMLTQLRTLDVSVAVDDFGTGYSSLKYLNQLPIDVLKIDKSFILELDKKPDNAAIADSIITLAHNLQLKVVAEGVENKTELAFLSSRGCDMAQGYYFYRPMPHSQISRILRKEFRAP